MKVGLKALAACAAPVWLAALSAALVASVVVAAVMAASVAAAEERVGFPSRPYHHTEDGFRNLPNSPQRSQMRWPGLYFTARMIERWFSPPPEPAADLVLSEEETRAGLARHEDGESVTWLGHAGFLLRLNGDDGRQRKVLIDPFFSERSSPVSWLGPKRYAPPPLPLESLPEADILIISHNHYEHLDAGTIENLPGRETMTVVAPLKVGDFFRERGYRHVVELDWWESVALKGLRVRSLPAVHWSRRGLCDRNETLWMSMAVESEDRVIYHSGDTDVHPDLFQRIAATLERCDVGLLAIGAYSPRFIMKGSHMTPEDAVAVGEELGCGALVGHHWGTLPLGNEPPMEPIERFRRAGALSERVDVWDVKIGETRRLPPLESSPLPAEPSQPAEPSLASPGAAEPRS